MWIPRYIGISTYSYGTSVSSPGSGGWEGHTGLSYDTGQMSPRRRRVLERRRARAGRATAASEAQMQHEHRMLSNDTSARSGDFAVSESVEQSQRTSTPNGSLRSISQRLRAQEISQQSFLARSPNRSRAATPH